MKSDAGFVEIAITVLVLIIVLAISLWAMVFVNRGAGYAVSIMTSIGRFTLPTQNVTPLVNLAVWAAVSALVMLVIVAALKLIRGQEEER